MFRIKGAPNSRDFLQFERNLLKMWPKSLEQNPATKTNSDGFDLAIIH
jgi:hypothetical protein